LGRISQKARLNVGLPPALEKLIMPRPMAYVLARQIELVDVLPPARKAGDHKPVPAKSPDGQSHHDSINVNLSGEDALLLLP